MLPTGARLYDVTVQLLLIILVVCRMLGAREESMAALIAEVDRRWQGPEGYFKQLVGLGDNEIKHLRDVLSDLKDWRPRPSPGSTRSDEDPPIAEIPG